MFLFCTSLSVRSCTCPKQSTDLYTCTQTWAYSHGNERTEALTYMLMHFHKHTDTRARTHNKEPQPLPQPSIEIRIHAGKVLPRRMSATLSSLKPAKYSLSAAVLSKLPTQARKRHQLPGRGVGRPAAGKGPHAPCLPQGSFCADRGLSTCRRETGPLVTDTRQQNVRSNHGS